MISHGDAIRTIPLRLDQLSVPVTERLIRVDHFVKRYGEA